jgi:hypothetical protein
VSDLHYFAMEKLFLRKRSRSLEGLVHSSWRYLPTTYDIYEPIVHHLRASGEFVKHGGREAYPKLLGIDHGFSFPLRHFEV